ncbi:MAG: hypothetical protein ACLTZM_05245 [Ruminococcus sp.]
MTEKKQQHKKKRGKVQHIRGSPKKRKISGKAVFSSESIPGKMLADVKNLITDKVSELKRADQKKLFLANFPYLMFAYFFNKIAWLYRVNTGATSWDKFMNTITYFELAFQNLWPSLNHMDLFWGIAGGVACKIHCLLFTARRMPRNIRQGVEYGSATVECIILTVNNDFMDAGGYAHEQLQ